MSMMDSIRKPLKRKGGTHQEDMIAWALDALIDHYEKHPRHGPGCACSDEVSRRLRIAFRARRTQPWSYKEPDHIQKAYRTLSGIFYRLSQEY